MPKCYTIDWNVFLQESEHLVARILEQNIVVISQVLMQRSELLLSLLNHTLKEKIVSS